MISIPNSIISFEGFRYKMFTPTKKDVNLKFEFHHNLIFCNNSFSKILFLL